MKIQSNILLKIELQTLYRDFDRTLVEQFIKDIKIDEYLRKNEYEALLKSEDEIKKFNLINSNYCDCSAQQFLTELIKDYYYEIIFALDNTKDTTTYNKIIKEINVFMKTQVMDKSNLKTYFEFFSEHIIDFLMIKLNTIYLVR